MFKLTAKFDNKLEFKGTTYEINDSFDNVLLFWELMQDDLFTEMEKVTIANEMLTGSLPDLDLHGHYELFKAILKEKLDVDLDAENSSDKKVIDFEQDAEMIYASFLTYYDIDLIDQQGKMSWVKFMNLLRQLDDNSQLKKAIGYRVMKIPKETKYNKDQVKQLRKMKEYYKLEQEEVKNNDDTMNSAFQSLKKSSKKAGES